MKANVIDEGTRLPSTAPPAPSGWVIEAIIEARLAWLVKPIPGEYYSFTFDFEKAHVFDRMEDARNEGSVAWCGLNSRGFTSSLIVVLVTDEYRADVAQSAQCEKKVDGHE